MGCETLLSIIKNNKPKVSILILTYNRVNLASDCIPTIIDRIGNIDDEVLIWGGGIWEWFEPLNLIRAVDLLRANHPSIRLHFLGVKHPNKHIPFPERAKEAISLADELGLKDYKSKGFA